MFIVIFIIFQKIKKEVILWRIKAKV